MERSADDEPIAELLELTRQLRGQLARHAALGAWAAPGGPSERPAEAADVADAADAANLAVEAAAIEAAPVGADGAVASAAPATEASAGASDGHPAFAAAVPHAASAAAPEARPASALPGPAARVEVIEPAAPPLVLGRKTLPQIRAELGECTRCKLHSTRRSIVFGVGTPDTPLMFVGEAPGEQEDRRGEPFVGPAGQLLDKMIEAMGWTRATVYIANTTKCRPPGNRNPQPDELAQCMPFLHEQIAAIAPRIIVALGRPASNQLLERDAPISALRGKFHDYPKSADRHSLKIMPTFHPAYLLREPDRKRDTWSDLKLVIAELARLGIASPNPPRA